MEHQHPEIMQPLHFSAHSNFNYLHKIYKRLSFQNPVTEEEFTQPFHLLGCKGSSQLEWVGNTFSSVEQPLARFPCSCNNLLFMFLEAALLILIGHSLQNERCESLSVTIWDMKGNQPKWEGAIKDKRAMNNGLNISHKFMKIKALQTEVSVLLGPTVIQSQ